MAAKPPYLALIANNLQRFDIADHRLLGDAMFNLSQEQLKDLISDDGYGRVFSGFTPTWTAGTNTIDFTVGVAVNSDGELMVRDTAASRTITPVNSRVYGVYAVIEEIVDTALVSRRKWNGTVEVVDNSVPVKTFKKVSLGEVSDTFSSSFTVGSLFSVQVSGKTILPLAAVTVDGDGVKTFYDCRRMWAVNGNVQSSIGLAEEIHNFAPTDNETLGITGVRTFFRAVADRIKAITGKGNWWTTPAYNLQNLWDILGTGGTGVRRIRTVAAYTNLTNLSADDGDFVYATAQSSLYQYIEGDTTPLNNFRVVDRRTGPGIGFSTGRWFLLASKITDVPYGFAGLDVLGVLSQTDVIKTSNIRNGAVTKDKLTISLPQDIVVSIEDAVLGNFYNYKSPRLWKLASTGHQGGAHYTPAADRVCNIYKNSDLLGTITFKSSGAFESSLTETDFSVGDVLKIELQGGYALQGLFVTLAGSAAF